MSLKYNPLYFEDLRDLQVGEQVYIYYDKQLHDVTPDLCLNPRVKIGDIVTVTNIDPTCSRRGRSCRWCPGHIRLSCISYTRCIANSNYTFSERWAEKIGKPTNGMYIRRVNKNQLLEIPQVINLRFNPQGII